MTYAILITIIGMGAVFVFLLLLMWTVQLVSYFAKQSNNDLTPIAAVIAIALDKGDSK